MGQLTATRKTLLLIEDSPTQSAQLKLHLESLDYVVNTVNSATEGLNYLQQIVEPGVTSLLRRALPDLILLDYLLPDQDGISVSRQLKADPNLRSIPILMFSTENRLQNVVEAYDAGVDFYVVKNEAGFKTLELMIEAAIVRKEKRVIKK